MVYRDLIKKNIILVGDSKINADIQEFFCELNFVKVIVAHGVADLNGLNHDKDDVVLLAKERQEIEYTDMPNSGKPFYSLSELYEMVDELETFYIDKNFNDRTICLYGNAENIRRMLCTNPHLKVDYILSDNDELSNDSFKSLTFDELGNMSSVFVILADDVNMDTKTKFEKLGLDFGSDFHFYNPRIPQKPTSYYLRKTLMDEPKYTIPCDYTKKALSIKAHGNIMACCSSVGLSMGNYLYTSIEEILRGIQAQLIRLSINNRTYSFCGEMCYMFREEKYRLADKADIQNNSRCHIPLREIKDFNVQLGYDRSCNLACPSCRDHRIIHPEDDPESVQMMHDEVKRMCGLNPKNIRIGNGELFFSKYYKDIIFNQYQSNDIALISNGLLFTPDNWSFLERRYKNISLEVSMDAINPETYKKLRGGDLGKLHRNMEFAAILRKEGKLKRLSISFVIQVENFREMPGFVEYGKNLNADYIHFMKLNSWGHISEDQFIQMDVYDERNEFHDEFIQILRNPLFFEPYVHVDNIENFVRRES